MHARRDVPLLARRAAHGRRRLQPGLRGRRRRPGALALALSRPEPRPRAPPPRRLVIKVALEGPPPPPRLELPATRVFPFPAPVSFYDHHDPSPRSLLFGLSRGSLWGASSSSHTSKATWSRRRLRGVLTHVGDSLVKATPWRCQCVLLFCRRRRRTSRLRVNSAEDRSGFVCPSTLAYPFSRLIIM